MTRHSAIRLSLSSRTSELQVDLGVLFFKTAPWSYVYWFILQNPILEVAKAVNIVKEWVKHQTVYESGNESIQKTAKIPLANVLRSIKLCASAQMQGERFACLSLRLHCFTRWCWVMVHARWFPVDVEQWQPSVKFWWEWKGRLCGRVGVFFSSFFTPFKSLSHQSWNLTPSFCFSFGCDIKGHEVCHSEAAIAFCGPQFKYVSLCCS